MSLIYRSSLLRAQRCLGCPGAPKPGCGSCGSYSRFGHRCGCVPCIQVPLDNRIVFRNACCQPKPCDCHAHKQLYKPHGCGCHHDCD